ncbi:MAG: DUF2846 domain-containing protein [Campylobacteraceae bacterium]|jgi:hypothetical protein|nr:DUF2846 domain-containing protein [Campylobacteraceae bacterium]
MKKTILLFCVALTNIWLLSGCAVNVPMASEEMDLVAKEFKIPAEGNAGVYIYRNEFMGAAIKMNIFIDNWLIGSTASKTYHYLELFPGNYTFMGSSENDSTLNVDVAANKLYYIWQEVKMGIMYARNKLHLVDEFEGQKGVLESKLAISNSIDKNK